MKKLALAVIGIAVIAASGLYYQNLKKAPKPCVVMDSKNDLEVCEFSQATIILSRGGQAIFPKNGQGAAPSITPAAPKASEKK
jgi:hypothetical protein